MLTRVSLRSGKSAKGIYRRFNSYRYFSNETVVTENRSTLARTLNPWVDLAASSSESALHTRLASYVGNFGICSALMCGLSATMLGATPGMFTRHIIYLYQPVYPLINSLPYIYTYTYSLSHIHTLSLSHTHTHPLSRYLSLLYILI